MPAPVRWTLIVAALLAVAAPAAARNRALCRAEKPATPGRWVHVVAATGRLAVCEAGRAVQQFPVRLGARGMGKVREGDRKTPIGTYRVSFVGSRSFPGDEPEKGHFQIGEGRGFCRSDPETGVSHFDPRRDRKGHPWTPAYGAEAGVVLGLDYPNDEDRKAGRTGSCIEIHSAPASFRGTLGCIALMAPDMKKLGELVDTGTVVVIEE